MASVAAAFQAGTITLTIGPAARLRPRVGAGEIVEAERAGGVALGDRLQAEAAEDGVERGERARLGLGACLAGGGAPAAGLDERPRDVEARPRQRGEQGARLGAAAEPGEEQRLEQRPAALGGAGPGGRQPVERRRGEVALGRGGQRASTSAAAAAAAGSGPAASASSSRRAARAKPPQSRASSPATLPGPPAPPRARAQASSRCGIRARSGAGRAPWIRRRRAGVMRCRAGEPCPGTRS